MCLSLDSLLKVTKSKGKSLKKIWIFLTDWKFISLQIKCRLFLNRDFYLAKTCKSAKCCPFSSLPTRLTPSCSCLAKLFPSQPAWAPVSSFRRTSSAAADKADAWKASHRLCQYDAWPRTCDPNQFYASQTHQRILRVVRQIAFSQSRSLLFV